LHLQRANDHLTVVGGIEVHNNSEARNRQMVGIGTRVIKYIAAGSADRSALHYISAFEENTSYQDRVPPLVGLVLADW